MFAGVHPTSSQSRTVIDGFMIGGKRTSVSYIFFHKYRTPLRGMTAQKAKKCEKTAGTRCRRSIAKQKILSAAGRLLSRIENQLLYAPIEDFGDEQHVLGRACDFVDPAELLELLAGFAEHAQHLAIEGKLVDAARMGVGTVEYLIRRRR